MKATDLEVGKTYWFESGKEERVTELVFMNKVHNRRAYRFIEVGKKRLFVVHNSRLTKLYGKKKEAQAECDWKSLARRAAEARERAIGVRAYLVDAPALILPPIDQWAVATGFVRRYGIGRW